MAWGNVLSVYLAANCGRLPCVVVDFKVFTHPSALHSPNSEESVSPRPLGKSAIEIDGRPRPGYPKVEKNI